MSCRSVFSRITYVSCWVDNRGYYGDFVIELIQ